MPVENYSYEDELNHQRQKNRVFTKNKIVMFKLIDLKQNLYFSRGIEYHDHMSVSYTHLTLPTKRIV